MMSKLGGKESFWWRYPLVLSVLWLQPVYATKTVEQHWELDTFLYEGHWVSGINQTMPSPIIEVNQGDRLKIRLTNKLKSEDASIHWHGFEMREKPWYDGVMGVTQCGVAPGTTFVYDFVVNEHPGTYWYHSHTGLDHVGIRGVAGALIVLPSEESGSSIQHEPSTTVFLQDWDNEPGTIQMEKTRGGQYPTNTRVPLGWTASPIPFHDLLINGKLGNKHDNVLKVREGQTTRLRLINAAGNHPFKVSVDDHELTVVASDGADTEPLVVDAVHLAPAERYDVMLDATLGDRWLRVSTLERDGERTERRICLHYVSNRGEAALPSSSDEVPCRELDDSIRMRPSDERIINCFDGPEMPNDSTCLPVTALKRKSGIWHPAPDATQHYVITSRFTDALSSYGHFMKVENGSELVSSKVSDRGTFIQNVLPDEPPLIVGDDGPHMPPNAIVVDFDLNATVQIVMQTKSRMSHPMHFHGHKFHVMGMGFGDPEKCKISECEGLQYSETQFVSNDNAILKDTVVLPAGGWVAIRIVADNPGWWLAHCHIDIHRADGMAFLIKEGGDLATLSAREKHKLLPADFPQCPPADVKARPEHVDCSCFYDTDAVMDQTPFPEYRCSFPHLCRHHIDGRPEAGMRNRHQGLYMRIIALIILSLAVIVLWKWGRPSFDLQPSVSHDQPATHQSAGYSSIKRESSSDSIIALCKMRGDDEDVVVRVGEVAEKGLKVDPPMECIDEVHGSAEGSTRHAASGITLQGFGSCGSPLHYDWKNIRYEAQGKVLVDNSCGTASSGELLGVLGPSGAGKTVLLKLLCKPNSSNYTGAVHINGRDTCTFSSSRLRDIISFVPQADLFHDSLPVKTTLMLAARFRDVPNIAATLSEAIAQSGFEDVEASMVGSLSGGERRRLSAACAIISRPSILMLDEPLSGLDAHTALQMIRWLRQVVQTKNLAGVMSVHMPSLEIYNNLDKVHLIKRGGQTVFHGHQCTVPAFFESIGLPIGTVTNPAEHMLTVVSLGSCDLPAWSNNGVLDNIDERLARHQKSSASIKLKQPREQTSDTQTTLGLTCAARIRLLLKMCLYMEHGAQFNMFQMFQTVGLGVMTGLVWWRVGTDDTNRGVREEIGLIFFMATLMSFSVLYPAIAKTTGSIPIAKQEISNGWYNLEELILCRFLAETFLGFVWPMLYGAIALLMAEVGPGYQEYWAMLALLSLTMVVYTSLGKAIGSMIPNVQLSMSLATVFAQTTLIAGGFYRTLTPAVQILGYISPLRYAFGAMMKQEFSNANAVKCHASRANGLFGPQLCAVESNVMIDDLNKRGIAVATSPSDPSSDMDIFVLFIMILMCHAVQYICMRRVIK